MIPLCSSRQKLPLRGPSKSDLPGTDINSLGVQRFRNSRQLHQSSQGRTTYAAFRRTPLGRGPAARIDMLRGQIPRYDYCRPSVGRPARPHPRHHRRPPRPHPGPPACCRPRRPGRPGLPRPGRRGGRPAVVTGCKATHARRLASAEEEANRVLAAGRVPVERGFAHLKNWRILTKLRTDPAHATHLFGALLILTNIEATTDNRPLPQVDHDQHMPPEKRHRAGIG
ncbi:transposase family protein [Streptomyces violaceus]|uniref:transposase family protein n=2 Tax=Streptomyces TaxID=1883 RepID=UPI00287FBC33|nr:transposase family protein [Streptomyces sp. CGMCC 4.1456]WNF66019.1 transposase family protein [Streptomyces sp. CGMCC 4.1456]